jgi:repressor LexA
MRVRRGLSARQERMLEFIRQFIRENGLPPTVRDIQAACDISSTSVVDYNLRLLQRDGYLNRRPDVARGIELVGIKYHEEPETVTIPIVAYIAAGQPRPALTDSGADGGLGMVTVPPEMAPVTGDHYALRVQGMSMMDAFVTDGDIVVLEKISMARNGAMVAAWLRHEEEATLKHFYHEGQQVRLQPANSQMEPFYYPADNVEILGRVVGVIRIMA